MKIWLWAVWQHGTYAREFLMSAGYHPKVIYAKAIKSGDRGYTDYGTVADRPWLTDKGMDFLAS